MLRRQSGTLSFQRRAICQIALWAALLICTLLGALRLGGAHAAPAGQTAGPDLTVEIQVIPAVPNPGEQAVVRMTFRNRGTATSANATFYFYVNPAQRPPVQGTAPSYLSGVPPLPPGGSFQFDLTVTFDSVGCDHEVFAWVDRDNLVSDADRSNNLVGLPLCVGVQCEVDAFESDDNAENAGWLQVGGVQPRSFCRDASGGLSTVGDQDWVKFTAFAGLTYTLSSGAPGLHADPRITLWSSGVQQALAGPGGQVVWQPPASGVYYAQVRNSDDTEGSGPLSGYTLALSAVPAVTDAFEPDDQCGQARTIGTDGTRQTRLFQAPGDVDWIQFSVAAGETFALVADNTGSGVNPLITLFSSCSQARSNEQVAAGAGRVEGRSVGEQLYFARIANQNPDRFGADARYDVAVSAAACAPDGFEEDDSLNQAQPFAAVQTHNICPAGDQDWVRLELTAGQVYVIRTSNLGFAADTVLTLWDAQGGQIALNDDYDYVKASRIAFEPAVSGVHYAVVRHSDPAAAGANTNYDLIVENGFCIPDAADSGDGDNGPGDAPRAAPDGSPLTRNFCADPLARDLGDQDWVRFAATAGARYHIRTEQLGPNSDTLLNLYAQDGATLLASNDDSGAGLSAEIVFTPTVAGDYFVQARQFNTRVVDRESTYDLRIVENLPPPPPPTPTPTPPPPTPTPPPPDPSTVRTLILVNRAQLASIHGAGPASQVMDKLFDLADHPAVDGAVLQVESVPAVASAYGAWLDSPATLTENDLANDVAAAIRNTVLDFAATAPELRYLVIVGDDRVIPFRRVAEANLSKQENEYAAELAGAETIAAALAADMILTDDFYADREPSQWQGRELYVPDFAVGRLIQEPDEIIGQIDAFLADQQIETQKALVTGYDFVQDSAVQIRNLLANDGIPSLSPPDFVGPIWPGDALRTLLLTSAAAGSRHDLISINGHATHLAIGVPLGSDIQASEVLTASNDFTRALVYNMGCHGGLNDPAALDLAQAFVRRGAVYVGNTGFGWGGGGIVYSEALMRNFTRQVLTNTQAQVGPALATAKQLYVSRARLIDGYDAKILMQTTLYGLPMYAITSGGALSDEDPFPSVEDTVTPPGAFGDDLHVGAFAYGLPGSFGSFGADDADPNYKVALDGNVDFAAGAPILPGYYRDLTAANAGQLRGVLFLGGVYTDTPAAAPLALAYNEYITDTTPPEFTAPGWYPPAPFGVQSSALDPALRDTVVLALGQYDPTTGVQRVYAGMSFGAYYSDSPDRSAAAIHHVDATLDEARGKGRFKVEASDPAGVVRVVVAATDGAGVWSSQDLAFDAAAVKWTGEITATTSTRYFVQVVDGAGNIAINDDKGRYHALLPPLPLIQGRALDFRTYLPNVRRGD
jgi:hypothetical protein